MNVKNYESRCQALIALPVVCQVVLSSAILDTASVSVYKNQAMRMTEAFYTDVGRRIQKIRSEKKLSQASLGLRLEPPVTRACIANMEAGKQRILAHTLVQLAAALETQLTEIVPSPVQADSASREKVAAKIEAELTKKLKLPPEGIKKLTAKLTRPARRGKK